MEDFLHLQSLRTGDLDRRGLGLSPAMLEDCCINAESLEELFGLLQVGKTFRLNKFNKLFSFYTFN